MLQDIDTEIYSAHNKGKSVVAERLIRTLKIFFFLIFDFNNRKCAC